MKGRPDLAGQLHKQRKCMADSELVVHAPVSWGDVSSMRPMPKADTTTLFRADDKVLVDTDFISLVSYTSTVHSQTDTMLRSCEARAGFGPDLHGAAWAECMTSMTA